MSTRKKPTNFVQRLLKRVWRSFNVLFQALLNGVLRGLRVNKRRSRQTQAGFVLPTVVMVLLVVALLTTAIVIRSFDRAKNASNFRVDQAVLNAATPAIDRAKAKIERLLSPDENRLAGSTPDEGTSSTDTGKISYVLNQPQYTFGDETRLKLAYKDGADKQTLETVWKFAVDTDNNGKYDTFTLYGIYFRNPPVDANGKPTRARTPIEARAVPQATGAGGTCGAGSGGAASGSNGWYPTDGQLKKAFFVYVANVPISQADIAQLPPPPPGQSINDKYEPYKGNKGFSALEMQEDQARISLDNNAVWYDDDLVISKPPPFYLNGRIHTNSNLMVVSDGDPIVFRQVSSINSCYYTRENGLITVGGNVVAGDVSTSTFDGTNDGVKVDLFNPTATPSSANINDTTETATLKPNEMASASGEYDWRLNSLLKEAIALHPAGAVTTQSVADISRYPQEVRDDFNSKYDTNDPASGRSILTQVLTSYFAKRIRRVTYKEGHSALTPPFLAASSIDPPNAWMSTPAPGATPALLQPDPNVALKISAPAMQLQATLPTDLTPSKSDNHIGDRILVGNALPTQWLKATGSPNTYANKGDKQNIPGVNWTTGGGQRWRESRVQQLDDLGDTSRGGFWEQAAAYSGNAAKNYEELAGGLRVVTGAGLYIDGYEMAKGVGTGKRGFNSFLPAPPTVTELRKIATVGNPKFDTNGVKLPEEIKNAADPSKYTVVWPDTMPMFRWDDIDKDNKYTWAKGEVKRGDLQMRATVVYHYNKTGVLPKEPIAPEDSKPIACIATYYDPTNDITAQNVAGVTQLDDQRKKLADGSDNTFGTSYNGINYGYEYLPDLRKAEPNVTILQRQADMIFPNGRWVNEPLKKALKKIKDKEALALNDIAAIDAANCALTIMYGYPAETNPLVKDGAIQERTFLDARQIKAIHKRDTDKAGTLLTHLDGATSIRQTLLEDITDPAKLKIAELGSLLTTEYSLPIEQRQPLEVRVTQIDLAALRTAKVAEGAGTGITDDTEYMLPNTGIIYATRDDALADASDPEGGSATDFKLDPTRRPNGIRLVNGENLAREDQYRLAEKGLILASDLPVYIKGPFNLHVTPGTTTFLEEFTTPSTLTNFYTRNGLNFDFACRPGSCPSGSTKGDQWRPARILADAVTLLSDNFRDGYRNEGDFDLNNNSGNLDVDVRLKQGFWWNSFATSAQWYGADGYPDVDPATATEKELSSYVTNGVTPIQRRVEFPEYKMEICRKLPVSECTWTDWVLEGAGTTTPPTVDPPVTPLDKARFVSRDDRFFRFPRRVAFKRQGGLLEVDATGKPIPLGVIVDPADSTKTKIQPYPYGNTPPPAQKNTLWFATTANDLIANGNTSPSTPSTGLSYNNTNQLFYRNPYEAETVSEKQILLPGMDADLAAAIPGLNGTTTEDLSDYAVYSVLTPPGTPAQCKASQTYNALTPGSDPTDPKTGLVTVDCLPATITAITQLYNTLRTAVPIPDFVTVNSTPLTAEELNPSSLTPLSLKAQSQVNVYDLPLSPARPPATVKNTELSNVEITLDRNYQQKSPIFVFRSSSNIDFRGKVTLKLKGVDPNNVFWVTQEGVRINGNFAKPDESNELVGNFIGTGAFLITPTADSLVQMTDAEYGTTRPPIIKGGRILAFNGTYGPDPDKKIPQRAMTAMTVPDQPALIPILQLHSPQGYPEKGKEFDGITVNANYWVQRVPSNTAKEKRVYNAVFIMGDSPSRPPGESGGGLHNFPRFLEAWEDTDPTNDNAATKTAQDIKGSFIQFKKSAFATAPFEAIDDPSKDNSLFFDGAIPEYMKPFSNQDYRYKGGAQGRKAPYYRAPIRDWGYDVGLLSQTPDLFSRRFANPTAGTPNQYFRQVNRNDPWIETLLCAAQSEPAAGAGAAPTYKWAIADSQQRPSNCPDIADFN